MSDTTAPAPGATHAATHGTTRAAAARPRQEDIVTGIMRQWAQVHPDLDLEPIGVIGRINRCAALLQQAADAQLRPERLTRAEFDLLGTLRRSGRPLTAGELARETFASGAAVTKRLQRLEQQGLVERRTDERDRRVAHLTLTGAGRELADRALPDQLDREHALLAGLSPEHRAELADRLAELLLLLEGSVPRS
ncbi:DNA-binding transcriptional regulator, MarR family [Streptacidiphilus jiangxiensis]|uniref:DNA-binding transcriptional regulator, MarR family n=2 Tax=Streptacidiphilus jiangxiensis TaxID=235985 RepID=A0A1H7QNY9_STRJI|nr:DNA-binding transcriptional regulator, MarR family [Streptacidiphilus jiangxiensis]